MKILKDGWLNIFAAIFILLVFFQTCGVKSRIMDNEDSINALNAKLDSVSNITNSLIITESEMIRLIEEVPAWETLRLEEISDKEKISINALKQKER